MNELELAERIASAKLAYDASGVRQCERVGVDIRRLRVAQSHEREHEEIDPAVVADARRQLWKKIPEFCRRKPSELLSRARGNNRVVAAVESWDWGSPSVLICGPTEIAKTSVVASIPIRLMARGREAEHKRWSKIGWFGASELTNAARSWPLGSGECPEVRFASRCDLLVLDDLGNETDWQSTIFDVLQYRYEANLPLLTTSGLNVERLLARYGDAIIRRLVQRNGIMGTIVDCWSAAA